MSGNRSPQVQEFFRKTYHPQVFGRKVLHRELHAGQFVASMCPHPRQYRSCGRGFGKSTGLVTDPIVRRSVLLPHIRGIQMGLDKPVAYKALIAAATKEQAFEIQVAVRQKFEQNDFLASELSNASTKTNLVLRDGQRIMVRPATAGARGIHPETENRNGLIVKGTLDVYLDEFAFFANAEFHKTVVKPMMQVADPYTSVVTLNSTPFGEVGETYEILTDKGTGECMQNFQVNESTGEVVVEFDRKICEMCMRKNRVVKFQFPTWWNPHTDKVQLFEEKAALDEAGQLHIYYSEYGGIPTSTAGLFFTPEIHDILWGDGAGDKRPHYRLNANADFVQLKMVENEDGDLVADEQFVNINILKRRRGTRFFGLDPNSGLQVKKQDFAAVCVVEVVDGYVDLILCERFKVPPVFYDGVEYGATDLIPFLLEYSCFLMDKFDCAKGFIDSGGGGPAYIPQMQKMFPGRIEAVPSSEQAKNQSLLHMRSLIMRRIFRAPLIRFLQDEMKFLRVNEDSLDQHDKIKIEKAAAHGTIGKEVDGWPAIGYACRGTIDLFAGAEISVSSPRPGRMVRQAGIPGVAGLNAMLKRLGRN